MSYSEEADLDLEPEILNIESGVVEPDLVPGVEALDDRLLDRYFGQGVEARELDLLIGVVRPDADNLVLILVAQGEAEGDVSVGEVLCDPVGLCSVGVLLLDLVDLAEPDSSEGLTFLEDLVLRILALTTVVFISSVLVSVSSSSEGSGVMGELIPAAILCARIWMTASMAGVFSLGSRSIVANFSF